MAPMEKIRDRIRKLVRLARGSSNEEEAALAMARAQEMATKHGIAEVILETQDDDCAVDPAIDQEFTAAGRYRTLTHWRARLICALAHANHCEAYWRSRDGSTHFRLTGTAKDAALVAELYTAMAVEINRLTSRYCKGRGRRYANGFRYGLADAVSVKVREAAERAAAEARAEYGDAGSKALVVLDDRAKRARAALPKLTGRVLGRGIDGRAAAHGASHADSVYGVTRRRVAAPLRRLGRGQ